MKYPKAYILGIKKDLGILRGWFEGFAAAGGKVSSFEDSLRKAQQALRDYSEVCENEEYPLANTPPSARVKHRSLDKIGTIVSVYNTKNDTICWVLYDDEEWPLNTPQRNLEILSDG